MSVFILPFLRFTDLILLTLHFYFSIEALTILLLHNVNPGPILFTLPLRTESFPDSYRSVKSRPSTSNSLPSRKWTLSTTPSSSRPPTLCGLKSNLSLGLYGYSVSHFSDLSINLYTVVQKTLFEVYFRNQTFG